jgi:hypothetical protein
MSAAVGLLALAGCKTTYDDEITDLGPSPVAVAKQVCEIAALAEERDTLIESIDADYPDSGGTGKEHRWTILKDKLREYRAEVEASYRFVTQACNSYNLCMEHNGYEEQSCAQTREAWIKSHEKFNHLAIALSGKPWRRHRRHHGGNHDGYCDGDHCSSLGGYSQDCCYDGD